MLYRVDQEKRITVTILPKYLNYITDILDLAAEAFNKYYLNLVDV
jgi:hypothetical protein